MNSIKVLILTANPSNTDRLRLDQEVREIEAELLRAQSRDSFELISKWAVRVDDLARALLDHNPQIIHFSGHGGGEAGLALEDDNGKLQLVKTEPLTRLFKLARDTVQCVVLNACYSQVQADAIHQHIDCVIGMNKAIGDKAAIQFASKFYQALAAGRSFQYAYDFACTILDLSGSTESAIPTLLNRNDNDNPFAIALPPPTPSSSTPEPPAQPSTQPAQSFSGISFGNHNRFNAVQATGKVNINQSDATIIQTITRNGTDDSDNKQNLEAALSLLVKLQQEVATTDALSTFARKDAAAKISMLQEELQQPQPDQVFVKEVLEALTQGLHGVLTLAAIVTQVASLVTKG